MNKLINLGLIKLINYSYIYIWIIVDWIINGKLVFYRFYFFLFCYILIYVLLILFSFYFIIWSLLIVFYMYLEKDCEGELELFSRYIKYLRF